MSAADLSQPNVNELDVMAYAASFHKAKGAKREIEKPVKIEWGRCATFSEDDINGAERSEQVFQNTKGLVTHQGLVNVPVSQYTNTFSQMVYFFRQERNHEQ